MWLALNDNVRILFGLGDMNGKTGTVKEITEGFKYIDGSITRRLLIEGDGLYGAYRDKQLIPNSVFIYEPMVEKVN